tara:strand:+ start:9116 stop:9355 length:240 start_codon:yes stop_codon:yes gene_type:complete
MGQNYGSAPQGYTGGAAGHVDTYLREKYMKLQEGYIPTIPDNNSYVARMQRSMIPSAPKPLEDRLNSNKTNYMRLDNYL